MKNQNIIYLEIARDLERLIETQAYKPGEKLPSVRKLSKQLGVSLGTIQSAYGELESKGLIQSRPQSGFVVEAKHVLPEPGISNPIQFDDPGAGHLTTSTAARFKFSSDLAPFGYCVLDPRLFPVADLQRSLNRASRKAGPKGLMYDFIPGTVKLREHLSKLSVRSGARLSPDEFVLTNGAIEAYHICLRAIAKAGDNIAVESPSYYGFLRSIENNNMRPISIPTHPKEGIDLGHLNNALKKHKIAAIMVVSNFSNPLGSTIPDDRKKDLVRMARQFDVPIIESDVFGDLHFGSKRPSVCKAYDRHGMVLLCSSFSKTLSPGYRVGWTAPGKFKSRVEWLIHESTFSSSTLMRLSIVEYLSNCNYIKDLSRIRQHCATHVQQTSTAITKYFPNGTRLTRPEGGILLWVELPEKVDSLALHQGALKRNISITPGPAFSPHSEFRNCIRINCGYALTPSLEKDLAYIGKLASS